MTRTITKNDFTYSLNCIIQNSVFDTGRDGRLSPEQLHAIYHTDKLFGGREALSAKVVVSEDILCSFTNTCRYILEKYTDPETDRLGFGVAHLVGAARQLTMADFASILVRAGAILGESRTADLLFGWVNDVPVNIEMKILLSGVTVDQKLDLPEGLRIIQLPETLDELSVHRPPLNLRLDSIAGFPGGAILAIDGCISPALYRPKNDTSMSDNIVETWAQNTVPGITPDSFCEALSLACDHCIRWRYRWEDLGDLEVFTGGVSSFGHTGVPNLIAGKPLWYSQFEQARDLS